MRLVSNYSESFDTAPPGLAFLNFDRKLDLGLLGCVSFGILDFFEWEGRGSPPPKKNESWIRVSALLHTHTKKSLFFLGGGLRGGAPAPQFPFPRYDEMISSWQNP